MGNIFRPETESRSTNAASLRTPQNEKDRNLRDHRRIFTNNQIIRVQSCNLEIEHLIGFGGFADVFSCKAVIDCTNVKDHKTPTVPPIKKSVPFLCGGCTTTKRIPLVAKVARHDCMQFDKEHRILKHLTELGAQFMPPIHCMGLFEEHRVIVMHRMSTDCESLLHDEFGKRMSPAMASQVVSSMLRCIEGLHRCGYIHNDVKPENFLLDSDGKIYLIDLGLASTYLDPLTNQHIELRKSKGIKGTLRFASINLHQRVVPSRRDDIESLFYVWLYFVMGRLPWQNLQSANGKSATVKRWKDVLRVKQGFRIDRVCNALEPDMIQFIEVFRDHFVEMGFQQCPDYQLLYSLLRRIVVVDVSTTLLGGSCDL